MERLLSNCALKQFITVFQDEEIDIGALLLMCEDDLTDLTEPEFGLQDDDRVKLLQELTRMKQAVARDTWLHTRCSSEEFRQHLPTDPDKLKKDLKHKGLVEHLKYRGLKAKGKTDVLAKRLAEDIANEPALIAAEKDRLKRKELQDKAKTASKERLKEIVHELAMFQHLTTFSTGPGGERQYVIKYGPKDTNVAREGH